MRSLLAIISLFVSTPARGWSAERIAIQMAQSQIATVVVGKHISIEGMPAECPTLAQAKSKAEQHHDDHYIHQARDHLIAGIKLNIVIWRKGLRPCFRQVLPLGHACLKALLKGATLAEALTNVEDFDFENWLSSAASSGLLMVDQTIQSKLMS